MGWSIIFPLMSELFSRLSEIALWFYHLAFVGVGVHESRLVGFDRRSERWVAQTLRKINICLRHTRGPGVTTQRRCQQTKMTIKHLIIPQNLIEFQVSDH